MAEQRAWPFVGREQVVARVDALLGAERHVVLTGPAGLGKTRVAAEVADAVAARRVTVHRMVASPASPVPLAPFAGLVGGAVGGEAVAAARAALGADGRAGAGDPVLLVDDLHLLDDASATVLHQLLAGGHVRLLATLRSTAAALGVPAAVERVRRSAGVEHVELVPLSDSDVVRMVETALGGALDGRARQLICSAAAGNPMYARELVEGSLQAGALTPHGGVFGFERELAATPLLEEVVLARLAPLEGAQLTALELLAVGGRLPYPMVERVVGFEPLEQMERMGLVVATADAGGRPTEVDVAHPLYRELTRARLGALARMRIHRTLADADPVGDAVDRPVEQLLRSAVWSVRGGTTLDPDLLLRVARHAASAGDTPLALELAEEAVRTSGRTDAALMASWCAGQMGRHDDATHYLRTVAAHEQDPWNRAAMHLRIAEELWWSRRGDDGERVLAEGRAPAGPWTALLDAQAGVFAMLRGDLPAAVAACEPLLDHEHVWVRFVATIGFTLSCVYGGRPARAIEASAAMMASLEGLDTSLLGDPNQHLAIQLVALTHSGQLDAAVAFAEAAYDETMRLPSIQARAWAAMLAGQAGLLAGNLERAARTLAEAERLWASVDVHGFAAWCAAGSTRAMAELGATDEAADALARTRGYDVGGFTLNLHLLQIAEAWVCNARGDRAAAADALRAAIRWTTANEQWGSLAESWHEAARLELLDLLEPVHAGPAATAAESPLAQARREFVDARRAGDAAGLERAGERFAEMGATVYAAEAAACAASLLRRSSAKDATRLDAAARAHLARAGGASTPLLAGRSGSGPLSAREQEIARLAAAGLSNRQIAERLVVSERTVENHLYRIFIKLGIGGRDELAGALPPD